MLKATYLLPLPSEELVSYEDIMAFFDIYSFAYRYSHYILIPHYNKTQCDFIIIANPSGIRVVHKKGWPNALYASIVNLLNCKNVNKLTKTDVSRIPTDTLSIICESLLKSNLINF
jgi:hypothetical protein